MNSLVRVVAISVLKGPGVNFNEIMAITWEIGMTLNGLDTGLTVALTSAAITYTDN